MNFIWYTRGRNWGLRFVKNGELADPFDVYFDAFQGHEDEREVFERHGHHLALRFPDPQNRKDSAGRIIHHDFVILDADENSLEDLNVAREAIWRLVSSEYETYWMANEGPI